MKFCTLPVAARPMPGGALKRNGITPMLTVDIDGSCVIGLVPGEGKWAGEREACLPGTARAFCGQAKKWLRRKYVERRLETLGKKGI